MIPNDQLKGIAAGTIPVDRATSKKMAAEILILRKPESVALELVKIGPHPTFTDAEPLSQSLQISTHNDIMNQLSTALEIALRAHGPIFIPEDTVMKTPGRFTFTRCFDRQGIKVELAQ